MRPNLGFASGAAVSPLYTTAPGTPLRYYGRGYVQLTWWSNYADAGKYTNAGLKYLFDPELVNDPAVAYQIMSTGMLTGRIFANNRRLTDFFFDHHTNYVRARSMVNGNDCDWKVAEHAKLFEQVLFAAQPRTVYNGQQLRDDAFLNSRARGV